MPEIHTLTVTVTAADGRSGSRSQTRTGDPAISMLGAVQGLPGARWHMPTHETADALDRHEITAAIAANGGGL